MDLLFKAFAACDNKSLRLVIVGEGKEKDNLVNLAGQLGISDRVEFRGFLAGEALRECYKTAGAFVLPTREDCFGLVLIEAMCAGLPIIVSRYSDGAAETVTEDVNGYIVDPYDTAQFTWAIDRTFTDEQTRKRLGMAGCEATEKFRFENVAAGYLEAIEDALSRR